MARVTYKQMGSDPKTANASTVGDLKRQLGLSDYSAKVNREFVDDDYALEDDDSVTLAKNQKGGH